MPLLFDWPKDRVNHVEAFDAAMERHVCERFAAALAAGTPVAQVGALLQDTPSGWRAMKTAAKTTSRQTATAKAATKKTAAKRTAAGRATGR